jgi:hypothetical protein
MLGVIVPSLIAQTAQARPGELAPRGTTTRLGASIRIEKPGVGEPPEDSDEATYRYDLYTQRDPAQATHEEKSRRLTEANDRIRDHLLEMRPGEIRWLWFDEQDCPAIRSPGSITRCWMRMASRSIGSATGPGAGSATCAAP